MCGMVAPPSMVYVTLDKIDVVVRRVHRALHLFGLHRAQIEEEDDEPARMSTFAGAAAGVTSAERATGFGGV
jgi:hypothetical protein